MAFEYYLLAKSHLQWIQSLEITSWKNIWFSVLTQNGSFSDEQNWKSFICWPNKGSIYLKFAFRHPICYNNYVGFFIHVLYPQNITYTDMWQIFVSDHVFFHSEIWPLWANAANQLFQDVIFNLFWFFWEILQALLQWVDIRSTKLPK